MKIKVDYYRNEWLAGKKRRKHVYSHSYTEDWEKTELYCPKCGHQGVWRDEDDNEEGTCYLCASCGLSWGMTYLWTIDEYNQQRMAALRRGDV